MKTTGISALKSLSSVKFFTDSVKEIRKENSLRFNQFLYILYQPYKFLVVIPMLVFSTVISSFAITLLSITSGGDTASVIGVYWARFNSFITPMFVKVHGKKRIDRNKSYILVANHQSQYDILIVYGWMPVAFKWVMKEQLRKVPFLGYACYRMGHIFIDRSNTGRAIDSINRAKERISNGTSILFFPEGTRSDGKELLEFRKGAFKMALDMGWPVLPVTIKGTADVLPNRTMALFPGRAEIIIHEPIEIEGYNEDNLDELMKLSRGRISSGL